MKVANFWRTFKSQHLNDEEDEVQCSSKIYLDYLRVFRKTEETP